MTLNLVLVTGEAVHVAADLRLTLLSTQTVEADNSPKLLIVQEQDWSAIVTYTGVARVGSTYTLDRVKEWLEHTPSDRVTFEQTVKKIHSRGNLWWSATKQRHHAHTFIIAGIENGTAKVALVSNIEQLRAVRARKVSPQLHYELMPVSGEKLLVTGCAAAVSDSQIRVLGSLGRSNADIPYVQRYMARVIAAASTSKESRGTISHSSFSYSLSKNRSEGHLHGRVTGSFMPTTLMRGQDLLGDFLKSLGVTGKVVSVGGAAFDATQPTPEPEVCSPTIVGDHSRRFMMRDLPDLGALTSSAKATNGIGETVGNSSVIRGRASHAVKWSRSGEISMLALDALHSHAMDINENGDAVGTFMQDGHNQGFLLKNGQFHIIPRLGGAHGNALAINSASEVVGGSCTLPGTTPGDKRERAFIWTEREGIRSLGAYAPDWASQAKDINDQGVVIGYSHLNSFPPSRDQYSFVWTKQRGLQWIAKNAVATNINNRSEVLLTGNDTEGTRYFIWTIDNRLTPLRLTDVAGINGMNDHGDFVFTRDTTIGYRAFALIAGEEFALPAYEGHQTEACYITNDRTIVGNARRGDHSHAIKWELM